MQMPLIFSARSTTLLNSSAKRSGRISSLCRNSKSSTARRELCDLGSCFLSSTASHSPMLRSAAPRIRADSAADIGDDGLSRQRALSLHFAPYSTKRRPRDLYAEERISLQVLAAPKGHATASSQRLDQQHIIGIVKADPARAARSYQSLEQDVVEKPLLLGG